MTVQIQFHLRPICVSDNCGSISGLILFLIILAFVFPIWFKTDIPLCVMQSLLLSLFFQIGRMVAICQFIVALVNELVIQ